jgi:hypothetical protein
LTRFGEVCGSFSPIRPTQTTQCAGVPESQSQDEIRAGHVFYAKPQTASLKRQASKRQALKRQALKRQVQTPPRRSLHEAFLPKQKPPRQNKKGRGTDAAAS